MFKLFKTKKKKDNTRESTAKESRVVSEKVRVFDTIIRPSITEKSSVLSESGVYTFYVRANSTKEMVKDAIEVIYKVVPKKVRISNVSGKPRRIRIRGREREFGTQKREKKAYVYLKKGDKIQLA